MAHVRDEPPSAHWLNPVDMDHDAFTYGWGKIFLGEGRGKLIGVFEDRHIVTIAGSRAGKSRTSLMTNLRTWPGSVIVIDPKGELATNTAKLRAEMGQKVHILDPFGEVKGDATQYRSTFNPIDQVRSSPKDDQADDAAILAESLVVPHDNAMDHWHLAARNLIHGLILWSMTINDNASLIDLRNTLSLPYDGDGPVGSSLLSLFGLMGQTDAYDGIVANTGSSYLGRPAKEVGSIIGTAVEQTAFLRSTRLAKSITNSDFRLGDLKKEDMSVYLVLPASRMGTHFRWLRVILTLAMAALEREENPPEGTPPVLFMLEEFPTLGYMRQIEAAAGLMAGYGVKLWTVMQDLSQIKTLYPKSWETFLGNAGIIEAFGNSDATTTEYLSNRIGNSLTRIIQPENLSIDAQRGGQSGERETIQTAPLVAPHEIRQRFARSTNRKLVLIPDLAPFSVRRVDWQDERLATANDE